MPSERIIAFADLAVRNKIFMIENSEHATPDAARTRLEKLLGGFKNETLLPLQMKLLGQLLAEQLRIGWRDLATDKDYDFQES